MDPDKLLEIDCYVDSNFAGLWGIEDPNEPTSLKSRTGWVIMVVGCPVTWQSKLQSSVVLSTMQAEYVALSEAMRNLLPFIELMVEVANELGCSHQDIAKIKTKVWEDNVGDLTLANLGPGRQTS